MTPTVWKRLRRVSNMLSVYSCESGKFEIHRTKKSDKRAGGYRVAYTFVVVGKKTRARCDTLAEAKDLACEDCEYG